MMLRMRKSQRGFTLLEMMIVVVIILIMAAIATPSLLRAIRRYQLESSGRRVANMILSARYEAMRRNQRMCAVFAQVGGENRYFLDVNGPCTDNPPTFDAGEPYIVTPDNVTWFTALVPATGLPAGYTPVLPPTSYRVTFDPRGTVVTANGPNWSLATGVQMICLLRTVPEFDAVLITVTPVGKIKLFRWLPGATTWVEM